jgi:UDPglucose 6-dehydrogenase
MRIGFMGLGKLGLPCALASEAAGHEVIGYDPNPAVAGYIKDRKIPYREEGTPELLVNTRIRVVSVEEMVANTDLIFVAVQTPHDPLYEGVTRIPSTRVDFNYDWLITAVKQLNEAIEDQGVDKPVVVISTVLPGTMDSKIVPLLGPHFKLCYNPFFIAMGTTVYDFTHPEFVLFGMSDERTADLAERFYKTIHNAPFYRCSIKSAELIKVAYNTFISTKLAFVNNLMEICHHTGADVDEVTNALKLAKERLISPKYLNAGMGDGGGCHPRDNIALSWLSRKLGMTFDFHEAIMMAREKQTEFLANLIEQNTKATLYNPEDFSLKQVVNLDVVILGKAFKEETNLEVGSPAILLKNILAERGIKATMFDPHVDAEHGATSLLHECFLLGFPGGSTPKLFFIGTHHATFKNYKFPSGSIVIDPWRMIQDQPGVRVIRVGEAPRRASLPEVFIDETTPTIA